MRLLGHRVPLLWQPPITLATAYPKSQNHKTQQWSSCSLCSSWLNAEQFFWCLCGSTPRLLPTSSQSCEGDYFGATVAAVVGSALGWAVPTPPGIVTSMVGTGVGAEVTTVAVGDVLSQPAITTGAITDSASALKSAILRVRIKSMLLSVVRTLEKVLGACSRGTHSEDCNISRR
jgi:hypothetical protein